MICTKVPRSSTDNTRCRSLEDGQALGDAGNLHGRGWMVGINKRGVIQAWAGVHEGNRSPSVFLTGV